MDASLSVDREGQMVDDGGKRGGWIIFLFMIVKSIDATQVSNVVNGCTSLLPIIGAIIADSLFGCFPVILISSCVSFLGLVLFTLTATLDSSRPSSCENGSSLCETPSKVHVSWGLGFGLSALVNLIGLVIFASGTHFYCRDKPQGSPFVNIARVIVASIQKWKVKLSSSREDYHYHNDGEAKATPAAPKKSFTFRFLNNAALETEGDLKPDGSIARPWRLCTLQQVEDLKTTIRILPCWSSNIFISTPHRDSNGLNGPPTSEDGTSHWFTF
ncbi:hypothetical protein ACFX2K_006475 [Malus domestica]